MTKELTTKTTTTALTTAPMAGIDPRDILLPILSIRQPTFKNEDLKKFTPGDVILRPANVKIATEEKAMAFVLLGMDKKSMVVEVSNPSQPKFVRYENFVRDLEWDFTEGGKPMKRYETFIAHILQRENLEKQAGIAKALAAGKYVDPDDIALPIRVTFNKNKAQMQAGKILYTHYEMCKSLNNQSPAGITFMLKTTYQKNDNGSWYAYDVAKADAKIKMTPDDLVAACDFWVKALAMAQFKAHEDTEDTVTSGPTVDVSETTF